jgi:1-phosphofructokinase
VRSTVGAGDAMVAGIVAGRLRALALEETARLASAFALAAITSQPVDACAALVTVTDAG